LDDGTVLSDSAIATTSDPFSTSLAGRRLGRYEVLARLASGGMAGVYVARALGVAGFERLFAVKVLHPHLAHEQEFITMFLDEARLAARIRHPNVVPTIDISDTQDAGYYLVMDYIEGDHFGALLQKAYKLGTRLPTSIALRVAVDTLDGLAAAHNLTDENGRRINLVHRDISPHNIMVSTDGVARITDFGVAKAEVRLSTTRQGQFKGKLAYMSPEHASTGECDQRSDLFSVAIILWESLTGRRLFRAENQAATLNKICIEPIPMPSSVDPALAPFDEVLERGLARDPAQRYQTAEEFAEAIEERAETLGGLANPRSVAKLVREYAAEKIERDRELIRVAIAEISAAGGGDPIPLASAPMSSDVSLSPAPYAQAPSMHAPPIELPVPVAMEAAQSRNWQPWLIAGVLVVVGVLALTLFSKEEPKHPAPAPAVTQPSAAVPTEPAAPAAPAIEPAAPTAAPSEGASAAAPSEGEAAPAEAAPSEGSATRTPTAARPEAPRESSRPRAPRETTDHRHPAAPAPDKPAVEKPRRAPEPPVMLNPYRSAQ
jgi:serine/threonine-protein kinase